MIENADTFTYLGTLFTHRHEVQLFEQGLLIMPLDGPLPDALTAQASHRPVLNESWYGWHPASRQKGAGTRWSFVNADWGKQFRGQIDGRKSLPAMAQAFLAARFDAQPVLAGAKGPVPVDLVLCVPVGDPVVTWQVLHWHGGLLTPAVGGVNEAQARENLRHEDLASVRDLRRIVPPADDRYLGQVAHGPGLVQVFSSGLLVTQAARPGERGWYPLRTVGANLTAQGARLMQGAGHLADVAAQGFPFLAGQYNAEPGDPHACYVWVGLDEQGQRQGFMVFDHPLRAPGSPGFDPRQGEAPARAEREAIGFAPAFDPVAISGIDQLARDTRWNVCSFVTAIQAAWYHAGRHDLFKGGSHATLVPVISAFLDAHPALQAPWLQDEDVQLSFAELKQLMARDVAMCQPLVDIGMTRQQRELLLADLGLRTDWEAIGQAVELTSQTLPRADAIYSVCDRSVDDAAGHDVYVTPDGRHLLWGRSCTADEALAELSRVFDGICDVVRFA